MVLHKSLFVKEFDQYGFSAKGLFVKSGCRIRKGESVWWLGEQDTLRTYTKEAIMSAPSKPTKIKDFKEIGQNNEYVGDEVDEIVVQSPRMTLVTHAYMMDDDCFGSTPHPDEDFSYYYNHSCEPNTVYQGDDLIIALRDIEEGEQVVYDYAFTETQDSFHYGMICKCGSAKCRGVLDFMQYRDPAFIEEHYDHCTTFMQKKMSENGWCHESVVKRRCTPDTTGTFGLVARAPIPRLTTIIVFAGKIVPGEYVEKMSPRSQVMSLQIDRNLWQVPNNAHGGEETGDFLNHCCDPNCGMRDTCTVITMRDIQPGEMLTLDYAMVTAGDRDLAGDHFDCFCGSAQCRGTVTNKDWKSVATRYWEFLSPVVRNKFLEQAEMEQEMTKGSATSIISGDTTISDEETF